MTNDRCYLCVVVCASSGWFPCLWVLPLLFRPEVLSIMVANLRPPCSWLADYATPLALQTLAPL